MLDYVTCSKFSLWRRAFSQTFVAFVLFSRGHSFMIKVTICIIKTRLGGDIFEWGDHHA